MANIYTHGFETGETAMNLFGGAALQSSVVNSGTKALQVTSLSTGTEKGADHVFAGSALKGPLFLRFYYLVNTAPSAANAIAFLQGAAFGNGSTYLTIDNNRQLRFWDDDGLVGSPSSALSLDTQYWLEMESDRSTTSGSYVSRARVNGVEFAARTNGTATVTGFDSVQLGGNLLGESNTTGNWYFDDIAVNDDTTGANNSWPGPIGGVSPLTLAEDSTDPSQFGWKQGVKIV